MMKKMILSAAMLLVSCMGFAQLNTTGVRYQANNRIKKVRMVVPDTIQAENQFKETLPQLQNDLAAKQEELRKAQSLQTKVGKKLKDAEDIETLKKMNDVFHSGSEFKAPKKISKSMRSEIDQYVEHVQNEVYDVERIIKLGWQGTEYPQKEYSTEMENENYRGLFFGDNAQLDKFDFEYQIKGYENKLEFDEKGKILKNDLYDKRGRLVYVASLLRTDKDVMDKVRSTIASRYKKVKNLDEALGCVYVIERVTKTSFRVIYFNSRTKKASYAALVTFRTSKANHKTYSVRLTSVPKGLPAVI